MSFELALALALSQITGISVEPKELVCLTNNIYHEARGESLEGQIAVAYVTINRVENPSFSDTICEVVYESKQFSWTEDGKSDNIKNRDAYAQAMMLAVHVIAGIESDPTEGATYFFNPKFARPSWAQSFTVSAVIGNHKFMRN